MPRRRFLSPEFFQDEDLAVLPFDARLLYAGLWCYADRDGRLEDRPKYLKAMLFPYDRVDMEKLLSMLANPQIPDRPSKVFIRRYQIKDLQLIDIPEFSSHQSPHAHEPLSSLPDIVGASTDNGCRTTDIVGASTDKSPVHIERGERTKDKGVRTKEGGQPKQKYGEFSNVHLSDPERAKVGERFGEAPASALIERLSRYIEQQGKDKYKSHYATLLAWADKDKLSAPLAASPDPDGYDNLWALDANGAPYEIPPELQAAARKERDVKRWAGGTQ